MDTDRPPSIKSEEASNDAPEADPNSHGNLVLSYCQLFIKPSESIQKPESGEKAPQVLSAKKTIR